MINSYYSTFGTRRVNPITNPVISHELEKGWIAIVITTMEHILGYM